MNWFDNITTVISLLGFGYIAYQLFSMHRMESSIIKGKNIPPNLNDFPIHQSSLTEYENSKRKIEVFKNSVLRENFDAQIILDENDINNIYTQGITLNKLIPGKYLFYKIKDSLILEKSIQWPSPGSPKNICFRISEIQFKIDETIEKPIALYKVVEERGIKFHNEASLRSLNQSSLILFIFGGSEQPDSLKKSATVEYQKALAVIEQIQSIKINNGYIHIAIE